MKTFEEIRNILLEKSAHLKNDFGIKIVGIFGSYIRGEQTAKSDLDILVELDKPINIDLIKFIQIEQELSDLIGLDVDLVIKDDLKPEIGKHVLEEVVSL